MKPLKFLVWFRRIYALYKFQNSSSRLKSAFGLILSVGGGGVTGGVTNTTSGKFSLGSFVFAGCFGLGLGFGFG